MKITELNEKDVTPETAGQHEGTLTITIDIYEKGYKLDVSAKNLNVCAAKALMVLKKSFEQVEDELLNETAKQSAANFVEKEIDRIVSEYATKGYDKTILAGIKARLMKEVAAAIN